MRNTLKIETIQQLSDLLSHGFHLEEAFILLESFENRKVIRKLKNYLKEGYNFSECLHYFRINQLFLNTFTYLYPIKGLSDALKDASSFVQERNNWISILKKQTTYPIFLITIMTMFSLFVKWFLLPEMKNLLYAFNLEINLETFSFIILLPNVLLLFVICVLFLFIILYYALASKNKSAVNNLLKIPIIRNLIQFYLSIIFAFYFSKISTFFESFYDMLDYFEKYVEDSNLKLVIQYILRLLNDGVSFDEILYKCPYFNHGLKQYFIFIFKSRQSFSLLDHYCEMSFQNLQKKFSQLSKLIMSIIYGCTGIYVLLLYSLMITPILEITSSL